MEILVKFITTWDGIEDFDNESEGRGDFLTSAVLFKKKKKATECEEWKFWKYFEIKITDLNSISSS